MVLGGEPGLEVFFVLVVDGDVAVTVTVAVVVGDEGTAAVVFLVVRLNLLV